LSVLADSAMEHYRASFFNRAMYTPLLISSLSLAVSVHGVADQRSRPCLVTRPAGRFEFTFKPTHGSWLNLIEGFFSKFARSVLRHIRMASKHELKERIMAGIEDVNRHPIIHTWSYRLAEAA
jgi:hypothetical protein